MRVVALMIAVTALFPTASHEAQAVPSTLSRSPVPEDIAVSLPSAGIQVIDASGVNVGSLPMSSQRAVGVALGNFRGFAHPYTSGWVRVPRVTVHLVRVVRSSSIGQLGLFPDQLVWLVVIRDVTIPNLGPPGRPGPPSYLGMLAVFVRTDIPRFVVAASF
jgi:hypothetical protein